MSVNDQVIEAATTAYRLAIASYLQQVRGDDAFCHDVPVKDFFDCVEGSYDYDTEFRIGMTAAVKAADAARADAIRKAALDYGVACHANAHAGTEETVIRENDAHRALLALFGIREAS